MTLFDLRQRYFAYFMSSISEVYDQALGAEKEKLFSQLRKQKSAFAQCKAEGSLKIVELGAGAGPNLKYYPEKTKLTVIDPNRFFENNFRNSLSECPGITLEGYLTGYGENLKELIADASVDAVVCTSVLCSVENIQKVYKEIQRILVPGGKFYYIEHIQGELGSKSYYLQKIVMATHLWSFMHCNCHIDRDLDHQIKLAQFSNVEQKVFTIDTSSKLIFHCIAPHVRGIATN